MIQDFDNAPYRAKEKLRRLASLPRDKQWRPADYFGVTPGVMRILEAQIGAERSQESGQTVKWRPRIDRR